jgi:hypothetical protein
MSTQAESTNTAGTRFRMYCQPMNLKDFEKAEVVTLSPPAGSIGLGPRDSRIKIIDAKGKKLYDDLHTPPYHGETHPPAKPDASGHFDYLDDAESHEFRAAHAYATLRMVLDVWEHYSGEPVRWFFAPDYRYLEVIPSVDWENGQAGYGYIELGYGLSGSADKRPFSLNFDVLAHEMGHIILASEVGMPMDPDPTQYAGFQEAASDIIALISLLHFDSFMTHLLKVSHGNLYAPNELNRLAELSQTEQIRTACHSTKMTDIPYAWTPARFLTQKQIHILGQPFTGAIFDILVEIFHESLVDRGAIGRDLDDLSRVDVSDDAELKKIQGEFDAAYAREPEKFREALVFARNFMGERLVKSWRALDPDQLTLWSAAASFMTVDRALSGMKYQNVIRECFRWRRFEP